MEKKINIYADDFVSEKKKIKKIAQTKKRLSKPKSLKSITKLGDCKKFEGITEKN